MKTTLLRKLGVGLGLFAVTLLPLSAAPEPSGIIVEVNGIPSYVTEMNLQIVSVGKGKKVNVSIPVFSQSTVSVDLKANTYELTLIPVATTDGISAAPSAPVLVDVERKSMTSISLDYGAEP